MSLHEVTSPAELAERRDRILAEAETTLEAAAGAALRSLLRKITAKVTPHALTAAAHDVPRSVHLFTLGEAAGWWDEAVDRELAAAVRAVWRTGYFDTADGVPAGDAMGDYMAAVKDRLSRTATPTIPEQAFDKARTVLAEELANGRGISDVSRRLAAEFGWDQDATFWRIRLADLDATIDGILDPLGAPGTPAREAARTGDAMVRALQEQRSYAVKQVDRVESTWQTRATRIARTESTGAYNAGALEAGMTEDAGVKRWMATASERTRDSHLAADGQCVPVRDTFTVGGASMQAPGDPSAPVQEVVNCRAVLPGTPVAGTVLVAMKRRWSGATCVIEAAGAYQLATTPEHPVLTLRGWVRADEVQPGDQCVRYRPGIEPAGQVAPVGGERRPHVGDKVPVIEQVHESAALAATRGYGRRAHACDLDEQGVGVDVDCVSLHDPFTVGGDTAVAQGLRDFGVAASRREMCVSRDPMTLVRVAQANPHSFAASTGVIANFHEPRGQHGAGYAEVARDRLDGLAGLVSTDHGRDVNVMARGGPAQPVRGATITKAARPPQPGHYPSVSAADVVSDLLGAHAGVVEAAEVISVRAGWFDGHVYDLQTSGGIYLAGGLIVHNCTVVFAADCEDVAERFGAVDRVMEGERDRRAEAPRPA